MIETPSIPFNGLPVLTVLVLLPAIAALAAATLRNRSAARTAAVTGAVAAVVLSLVILLAFRAQDAGMHFVERVPWLPTIGLNYVVGIDGLSVLFLPLTAVVFLAIVLLAPENGPNMRWLTVNFLILEAVTLGAYVAADAVLFFIFFELALIPAYFLIDLNGRGPERQLAARRYAIVMLLGSLPILIGFLLAGHSASSPGGALSFEISHLVSATISPKAEFIIFCLLLFGFAVKAPALPLHFWMPQSVSAAPAGFVVYLLGLKLGTYGFLRFVIPISPATAQAYAAWVIGVAVVAVIYAGMIALTRRDLRSLLVFSSISHVGLITAASFSGTADGWMGAILLMVNAGIATAGLAICAGMLERRLGTTTFEALGGVLHRAPRLSAVVFISGLALIGVPGTSGFAGEILALRGVFQSGALFGVAAAAGVVLSASYFLWAYQRAFLGEVRSPAVASLRDLDRRETVVGFGIMALALLAGLFPGTVTDVSRATVEASITRNAQQVQRSLELQSALQSVAMSASPGVSNSKVGTARRPLPRN